MRTTFHRVLALGCACVALLSHAIGIERIADIDARFVFGGSTEVSSPLLEAAPGKVVPFGSRWLVGLSVTDGTSGSTRSLVPAQFSWTLADPVVLGGAAFFAGRLRTQSLRRLWRSDGTPEGFTQFGDWEVSGAYAVMGGALYFSTVDGALWRSDGTVTGTARIGEFTNGTLVAAGGGRLFGLGPDGVWVCDGTAAGTQRVSTLAGIYATVVGAKVFFFAKTVPSDDIGSWWASDGTSAGTVQLDPHGTMDEVSNIVGVGNTAFVLERDVGNTVRVLASDGTTAGTRVLASGVEMSRPYQMKASATSAFFVPTPGLSTYVLWRTDGTVGGTGPVSLPISYDTLRTFSKVDGAVYASVSSSADGTQLYRFAADTPERLPDGPAPWAAFGDLFAYMPGLVGRLGEVPHPIDVAPGERSGSSSCGALAVSLGDRVLFNAHPDPSQECQVWITDGTAANTRALVGMSGLALLRGPRQTLSTGGHAFFVLSPDRIATRLYASDGTAAGTGPILAGDGSPQGARLLADRGSSLVFVDPADGSILESAGTTATTHVLVAGPRTVRDLAVLHGTPYWLEAAGGTVTLMRLAPGGGAEAVTTIEARAATMRAGRDVLYIAGRDITRSDGTAAGTKAVEPPNTPALAGVLGNIAIFRVDNELWRSDGTPPGTLRLAKFVGPSTAFDERFVYVPVRSDDGQDLLLRSDGTPEGTAARTPMPFSESSCCDDAFFTFRGNVVAVNSNSGVGATGMWITNGSSPDRTPRFISFDLDFFGPLQWTYGSAIAPMGDSLFAMVGDPGDGAEPHRLVFDAVPDALAIPDATGVLLGQTVTSAPAMVTGLEVAVPVAAGNGRFCVSSSLDCSCDIAAFSTQGRVNGGQAICVQHTAAGSPRTSVTTTLDIGGTHASFTSTTGDVGGLVVSRVGAGAGRIVSQPAGIDCGADCTEMFADGTTVTLTAEALVGDRFLGWSGGGCTGTGTCVVTLSGGVRVEAAFARRGAGPMDFDGDGREEILWRQPGGNLALSTPGGLVGLAFQYTNLRGRTGDFDGDGRSDILWESDDWGAGIWMMDDTAVRSRTDYFTCCTGWRSVAIADFNGDGKDDILWANTDGRAALWLMDGARQAGSALLLGPGTGWRPLFAADFDGDGKADIVWEHADGRTAIWLMDGVRQAGGALLLPAGTGWHVVQVGDLDGNGKADLFWQRGDGALASWLMNGASQVGGSLLLGAGTHWTLQRVADIDGNRTADLLLQNTEGSWAACTMQGASSNGCTVLLDGSNGWTLAATRDFDGDGRADLIWRRPDGGATIWLMNGLATTATLPLAGPAAGWDLLQ